MRGDTQLLSMKATPEFDLKGGWVPREIIPEIVHLTSLTESTDDEEEEEEPSFFPETTSSQGGLTSPPVPDFLQEIAQDNEEESYPLPKPPEKEKDKVKLPDKVEVTEKDKFDKNVGRLNEFVVLETNRGTIIIKLMLDVAPKACENFVRLVDKKYYNGTMFHRVIKAFMIQGGDPTGTGRGGESIWGKNFNIEVDENIRFDKKGIVAMANSGPNKNGSQFFITTVPIPHLHMKYTIFGKVISGFDVLKKIESVRTGTLDKPMQDQIITNAYSTQNMPNIPTKKRKKMRNNKK